MTELRDRRHIALDEPPPIDLPAGDVTEGIVRIGDTVRRPHKSQSYAVAAYLDHLEAVGFAGAPRFLGRDDLGRDVLTFVAGDVAGAEVEPRFRTDELLASVARLVSRLHEASTGYVPSAEPFPQWPVEGTDWELVSHMDVTPQNVTVAGNQATGLFDFDLARPTSRLLDGYNTSMHWVPLADARDLPMGTAPADVLRRLRIFADAIGWTEAERESIPSLGASAADLSRARMKERAEQLGGGWARMWASGVGDVIRRRAAWLRANDEAIVETLLR